MLVQEIKTWAIQASWLNPDSLSCSDLLLCDTYFRENQTLKVLFSQRCWRTSHSHWNLLFTHCRISPVSPFCTFLFDSIRVCLSSCTNHCKYPVMMSLWPCCEGLLIEAVSVRIQMSSLVPISVNLLGRLHAHKHTHTHTHTRIKHQVRLKDAPSDRMQPPGERKWLYPPKRCTYRRQASLYSLVSSSSTAHRHKLSSINHYSLMYNTETLLWLYDNFSLRAFIYPTPPSSLQ